MIKKEDIEWAWNQAKTIRGKNPDLYRRDEEGNPITMLVFVLAPGAFIALGYLIALVNKFAKK